MGLGTATVDIFGGDRVIIDGNRGVVIVRPDEKTIKEYKSIEKDFYVFEEKLSSEFKDLPAVTLDGREVSILGNIEFPRDIGSKRKPGCDRDRLIQNGISVSWFQRYTNRGRPL